MRTSPPRIHGLWIVFDSDGDTDPDTDAGGDGIRQEERGGDVHVAVPETFHRAMRTSPPRIHGL
jgi:hypothetical protein